MKYKRKIKSPSLSGILTLLAAIAVLVASTVTILTTEIYRSTMKKNAVTSSEQSVVQVQNMVSNYTEDMETLMQNIQENVKKDGISGSKFMQNLVEVREDVVAVIIYDQDGHILNCWSKEKKLKENFYKNLSYVDATIEGEKMQISKPHVQSLFKGHYPWVVTIARDMMDDAGNKIRISMDLQFSNIANYVDEVGIGAHGYCYIADIDGKIVYHPQQQLIHSGIKQENVQVTWEGTKIKENAIYTSYLLKNCNWRVVGVCYVDEMITENVEHMVSMLLIILTIVVLLTAIIGIFISKYFSKPTKRLISAMRDFEINAEDFEYKHVTGIREIESLSASFGHMVVKIQRLMEKVRNEEISLRKTELKALQAQINPHFLYNTLDAIVWLCEEGRNTDAAAMVTALAKLFRISISKGHELIPIEKEVQHAKSYLQIQTFRYKNQFTYYFDIDEECLQYYCNKITLQPIIENAIYHGLNRMIDDGEIYIKIAQDNDDIVFTVEDNGVGMTEEQCKEILQRDHSDRTGIGIKNVNDRIKIYFGEEYGLKINSELDEGTQVIIRMPKVKEDVRNE